MTPYSFSDFLSGWGVYFWPVVFIVIIGLLLVYILAKIIKSNEYEAKFNFEINELAYAFLAVFVTLALLGIGNGITLMAVHGTWLERIATTQVGIIPGMSTTIVITQTLMEDFTVEMYGSLKNLYEIQTCYVAKNLITKRNGETVLSYSYKIFPGSDMFVSLINTLSLPLNMAYSSVSAQLILTHLIEVLVLYFLLPVGILLRFIPGSYKQAGSFLLAFSIGALIVFPMVYVFTARGLLDIVNINKSDPAHAPLFPLDSQSGYTMAAQCGFRRMTIGLITNGIGYLLSGISSTLGTIFNAVTGVVFMPFMLELANPIIFWRISQYIGLTFVMAVFVPTLATILATSFISAYYKFLMSM